MPTQLLSGFSRRYLVKLLMLAITVLLCLNLLLNHMLHLQMHKQGAELAKSIAGAQSMAAVQDVTKQAQQYGFTLSPGNTLEPHVFSVDERSVTLYHQPIWRSHPEVLLFFNLLSIGLILFVHRWWFLYGRKTTAAKQSTAPVKAVINKASEDNYALFALLHWQSTVSQQVDLQLHFQLALVKGLGRFGNVTVKYLNSGALAVTVQALQVGQGEGLSKQIHELVYCALREFRGDLSRSKVKLGACFYQQGREQTQVYQSAKSALSIAQNQVWQHTHLIHLTSLLAKRLQGDGESLLEHIKRGQFSLFFQPLFDFRCDDIVVSEALLRVSHQELGRISAKQAMQYLHAPSQFQELDKIIINQVLSVYQQEQGFGKVSVNLHISSWLEKPFIDWLVTRLKQVDIGSAIAFELSIDEAYSHSTKLLPVFKQLSELGCDIYLDNIAQTLSSTPNTLLNYVSAFKLSFELIHGIEHSGYRRRTVKQIMQQAAEFGVPVYAVGVETDSELSCVKGLGVKGAQGHYFSAPLQQLADIH